MSQRDEQEAWEAAFIASGLPVALDARGRPRMSLAVPLPAGFEARAERLDGFLTDRVRAADVRSALAAGGPSDHPIVEVHDVWLGAPALSAAVVALDYRVVVAPPPGRGLLAGSAAALLAAARLERIREKGGRSKAYDLRPLLIDVRAIDDATIWIQVRADSAVGLGRPDEVVAALGEGLGSPLTLAAGVRERIWLADDGDPPGRGGGDAGRSPPVDAP